MNNILIIGGTYFTGRVFAMIANSKGYNLTFINRGTYSMSHLGNITEYKCDRHSTEGLKQLPYGDFDAVVDFCAYEPGDCLNLLKNLNIKTSKYILLSTADVYNREIRTPKDETAPLQSSKGFCAAADYMWNKRNLEFEAKQICDEKNIKLIILRPAFIYGPYNYAPRESFYVEKICKGESIPVPTDSSSKWNFVYVKDVAEAICSCIEKDFPSGEAFNLSNDEETITYESFMQTLKEVSDIPFTTHPVTVNQVFEQNIPVPFPLLEEESELFIAQKSKDLLGMKYTPLRTGLEKAYNAFKNVFI